MENRTRLITISAAIAALYIVLTVSLAPLSYGVLQFRVSEMLKPLALFHPAFAIAFGVGNGIANIFSPFGWYDWFLMALVDSGAALLCWILRRWPWFAVTVQALVIAAGVAIFPLGMGVGLPFWPSFMAVVVPQLFLLLVGYGAIWRKYGTDLLRWRQ